MPPKLDITDEERKLRHKMASKRWRENNRERVAAYMAVWRANNPNWDTAYRAANPDKIAKANKNWRDAHPEKASKHWKKHSVKRRFGISVDEYDGLLHAQNGSCYICGQVKPKMDLDHNHVTGAIRKFLCSPCNLLVGNVESNRDKLHAVLAYLEEHN